MAKVNFTPDSAHEIGAATRTLIEDYLNYAEFVPPAGLLDRLESFGRELARWGAKFNLTASPDDPAEVAGHILDSLMPLLLIARNPESQLTRCFLAGKRVLDLGSGAGFPGLILAASTEAKFVLLESRRKRASFLKTAIGAMALANAEVDSRYRRTFANEFDVVTARAFARPQEFYEVAATALKPEGIAILYASERQRLEVEEILHRRGDVFTCYSYEAPRTLTGSVGQRGDSTGRLIVVSKRG